ncbi:MAG: hypothetical protein K1X29_06660 [Bdellovibrionales bacterium]|nr:hypothetical protein [Bdellovibrionales bacterium]
MKQKYLNFFIINLLPKPLVYFDLKPLFLIGLFTFNFTSWALTLPKQLNHSDREQITRQLGLNTSTKLLSNPFPLGGYSGFEIGLSAEFIDIHKIAKLGCSPATSGCPNTWNGEEELVLPRLIIGKGLYENVDIFMHFTPQIAQIDFSSFGGSLRYSFFEAKFFPANISLVLNAHNISFSNEFQCLTLGADLVSGIYVDNISFYLGGGILQAKGTFLASSGANATVDNSDPEVNIATQTVIHKMTQFHMYVGTTYHLNDLFIAAQMDRYPEETYSARLGFRF